MSLPVELIYRQYQDGDVVGARAASLKLVRERIDILAGTGAPGSGLGELAAYTRKLDVLTRALRSLMFVETKNDAPNPPDLVPPVIKAYGVIDRALVLLESMTVLSDLEPIRREDWRAGDVLSSAERARHVLLLVVLYLRSAKNVSERTALFLKLKKHFEIPATLKELDAQHPDLKQAFMLGSSGE